MKAEEVVEIDLTGKTSIADTMIVASGRSHRHVGAIAERVLEVLKERGLGPARVEGLPACDWVLIDAGDVIVHVFRPEVRSFYNLEKMWGADRPRAAHGRLAGPCGSLVIAVGRLKGGPERDLAERYRERAEALGRSSRLRAARDRRD